MQHPGRWNETFYPKWEQHENVYLLLMTKKKLQEKYKDEISFVTGSGKSDINSTLTEA